MVGNFFIDNIKYPIFDDLDTIAWYEHFLHSKRDNSFWDDILCVNIGLDKITTPVIDEFNEVAGTTYISDRSKILKYLKAIADADYREVFLDVRFPKYAEGITSSKYKIITDSVVDNELFSLISKMRNIVVANHQSNTDPNPLLKEKYGMADYGATIFAGFGRYELRQNGLPSAALKMYQDIDHKDITPNGYFTNSGRLCYNTVFLHIPQDLMFPSHIVNTQISDSTFYSSEVYHYPMLGSYLLEYNTEEELKNMVKDKIVIIGDFDEDVHTTYVGEIPGSMLSYLAYKELHEGNHLVGWHEFLTFIIFAAIICFRLENTHHWYDYVLNLKIDKILNKISIKISNNKFVIFLKNNDIIPFVLSFFGWGVLMFLLKIAAWFIGFSLSAILPTFMFTILDFYKRFETKYLSKTTN